MVKKMQRRPQPADSSQDSVATVTKQSAGKDAALAAEHARSSPSQEG